MTMLISALLLLSALSLSHAQPSYPHWPKQYVWSWAGTVPGYDCISVTEPGAPAWADNKLCWETGTRNPGLRWSWAGVIPGMKCTRVADQNPGHWVDNYLCVPRDSHLDFTFSWAGAVPGKGCILMDEPGTPAWADNYLCASVGV